MKKIILLILIISQIHFKTNSTDLENRVLAGCQGMLLTFNIIFLTKFSLNTINLVSTIFLKKDLEKDPNYKKIRDNIEYLAIVFSIYKGVKEYQTTLNLLNLVKYYKNVLHKCNVLDQYRESAVQKLIFEANYLRNETNNLIAKSTNQAPC